MKVAYTTSLADYKAGDRMYRRRTFFFKYDQIIWSSITFLCFIVIAMSNRQSELSHQATGIFMFSLWFTIGLPILRSINAYRGYRSSLKQKRQSVENITEITADKIIDTTPGICELTHTWSSVIGFAQNAKITLFRTSGSHFIFFPTSALTLDQKAELNEFVSRHNIRRWS